MFPGPWAPCENCLKPGLLQHLLRLLYQSPWRLTADPLQSWSQRVSREVLGHMAPGFSLQAPLSPDSAGQRAGTQLGGRYQGSHGALPHLQENSRAVWLPAWWSSSHPCPRTRSSSFQSKYPLAFGKCFFNSKMVPYSLYSLGSSSFSLFSLSQVSVDTTQH